MKKYVFVGQINWVKRLNNSCCGNPRYDVMFANDYCYIVGRIEGNSQCAYTMVEGDTNWKKVTYHITKKCRKTIIDNIENI